MQVLLRFRSHSSERHLQLQLPQNATATDEEEDDGSASSAGGAGEAMRMLHSLVDDNATNETNATVDGPSLPPGYPPLSESYVVSQWFGGRGGDECGLACDSDNHTGGASFALPEAPYRQVANAV